jgi:hypothetical protein
MVTKNECAQCEMSHKDPIFWDTHQTMSDGIIWCPNGKSRSVDEMTTAIVSRYKAQVKAKYGNKKRHRQ